VRAEWVRARSRRHGAPSEPLDCRSDLCREETAACRGWARRSHFGMEKGLPPSGSEDCLSLCWQRSVKHSKAAPYQQGMARITTRAIWFHY
jgi:hypothetical protein